MSKLAAYLQQLLHIIFDLALANRNGLVLGTNACTLGRSQSGAVVRKDAEVGGNAEEWIVPLLDKHGRQEYAFKYPLIVWMKM